MSEIRTFATGATRDTAEGKHDYEGFISPLVTKRYGAYMHRNRFQKDGTTRDSDNWQKGIDKDAYVKSLVRHVEDVKLHHDGFADEAVDADLQDVLCAVLFNASGLLFEMLMEGKGKRESGKKLYEEAVMRIKRDAGNTPLASSFTGALKVVCSKCNGWGWNLTYGQTTTCHSCIGSGMVPR